MECIVFCGTQEKVWTADHSQSEWWRDKTLGWYLSSTLTCPNQLRNVAQSGSAPALGAGGRWFESSHTDQVLTEEHMKKSVFAMAVAAVLVLSACGQVDRSLAAVTGGASKTCVDGVMYLQFTSGATVQFDRTGKPVPCN